MGNPPQPLPDAARQALWTRIWDRLLQPLPSEIVPADEQRPLPDDEQDRMRRKELPR